MLPSTLTKLTVQQVAKEAVALLFVKAAPAGVVVEGGLVQMTDFRVAASGWMNMKPQMEALSDEELRAKTDEFKRRLADGETLDDILPEAFDPRVADVVSKAVKALI